jgi:hypothetical protein
MEEKAFVAWLGRWFEQAVIHTRSCMIHRREVSVYTGNDSASHL